MKKETAERLKIIEDLYPAERLALSKARWQAVWRNEPFIGRMPYVCPQPHYNAYNETSMFGERLAKELEQIMVTGLRADDYIPSLFCGCRQSTIPNMFGAPEVVLENGDVSCEKILFTPEDIENLPEFSMEKGTVAKLWLDNQRYFLEETEGRLPVHVVDMQGPFDVAGQMYGYDNLFLLAYEHPELYDKLMCRITDAFIALWQAQQKLLGKNFVGTHLFAWDWVPAGNGATMSVDSLVMVSPAFYEEFFKPYITRISKLMGGVVVHSCGNFGHIVPNLMRTEGLKGINSSQMTIKELFDAGMTKDVTLINYIPFDALDEHISVSKRYGFKSYLSLYGDWQKVLGSDVIPQFHALTPAQKKALRTLDKQIADKLTV